MWSWLEKIGDAWNSFYDGAASIGGTAATAADTTKPGQGLQFGHVGFQNYADPTLGPEAIKQASTLLSAPVNAAMRGATTVALNNEPFNSDSWSKAWGLTGEHQVDGQNVEGISLGQTVANIFGQGPSDLGLNGGLTDSPQAAAERYKAFHDTWAGQISSGAVDLVGNIALDPTVIAGKAGKAASLARATVRSDEITNVIAGSAGKAEIQGATGVRKALGIQSYTEKRVEDVNTFLDWTKGKTAPEIYSHPAMKANPEGGTFSYLLAQADKLGEDGQDVKRTLLGAALGDEQSIQTLRRNQSLLANDLYKLSTPPANSVAAGTFDHSTGNASAIMNANAQDAPEIAAKQADIQREMERLQRVIDARGTSNVLRGTGAQRVASDVEINSLRNSTIYTGLGNRPINLLAGSLRTSLPGQISLRDPVTGYQQLNATLKSAPYLAGTDRQALLNQWLTAASDGDRLGVVKSAEAHILKSTAEHYGVDPKNIIEVARHGETRRNAWTSLLQSRLYSADPNAAYVSIQDPEEDALHIISRPLLQSQIEEHAPIIDPAAVDKSLRSATNQRLLEQVSRYYGDMHLGPVGNLVPSVDTMSSVYSGIDAVGDLTSSALQSMTKLWKDSMLIPRALAYGTRIQVDSQSRLMAHMGFAGYVSKLPSAIRAQARYNKYMADMPLSKAFDDGDAEALKHALSPWLGKMGFDEGDFDSIINKVKSENGAHASLINDLSTAAIQKMRATGQWGTTRPQDPGWMTAWMRAVNQQIRNSPTAMYALQDGVGLNDLKRFVTQDASGRKEWLEMASTNNNDLDEWLGRVQAHVDHYLPDDEMRVAALQGPIDQKTADDWFQGGTNAMDVHGESYSPFTGHPIAQFYNSAREVAYKAIADGPETILARMPLYLDSYSRNLKAIVERNVAGGADNLGGALSQADMRMARIQADRIARREIKNILFDSSDMSNLAHTMRFVAPFFAAWEDMVKKWGTLFYQNPSALERFRQVWNIPENAGLATDENGNLINANGEHLDPKTGLPVTDPSLIGQRDLVRVPLSWVPQSMLDAVGIKPDKSGHTPELRIDKKSFNVVFQGDPWWLPGFGPLVEIPANYLVLHAFPEAANNPVVKTLLPFGVTNENPLQQSLPAWARYLAASARVPVLGDDAQWKEQADIVMREEWIKYQQGLRDNPTNDMGAIANKVKNYFLLRAALGLSAPVSVQPSQGMQFYIDQAHTYQAKYGQVQDGPEYKAALAQYQQKYGEKTARNRLLYDHPEYQDALSRFRHDFPQYFDLAVSISTNNTGIVASDKAVGSARKLQREISQNPDFGWMFVGPDNAYGFSDAAHTWELGQETTPGGPTYRSYKDPVESLKDAEVQNGWKRFTTARTKLNLILEQRGLSSLNSKGAEDLAAAWGQWVDKLAAYNQYWGHDYQNTNDSQSVDALNAGLQAMSTNKTLADRQDMMTLKRYAQARNTVMEMLAARGNGTLSNQKNADIDAAWSGYVQKLIAFSPGFEQIYNRALLKDQLTIPVNPKLLGGTSNGSSGSG